MRRLEDWKQPLFEEWKCTQFFVIVTNHPYHFAETILPHFKPLSNFPGGVAGSLQRRHDLRSEE